MCACESTTASSVRPSTGMLRFFSNDSRRRPWNRPQSSRTAARDVRRRCFDPVTVCAAPMNSSVITGRSPRPWAACATSRRPAWSARVAWAASPAAGRARPADRRRTRTAPRSSRAIVPWRTIASKSIDFVPVARAVEDDRDVAHELARLGEREHLAQLVERPEAAGKDDQSAREVREPELAHEEVVELEPEPGRDVRVGTLLVRQPDVEADGPAAGVLRAPVGRLHDAAAAARADHEAAIAAAARSTIPSAAGRARAPRRSSGRADRRA